MDNLAQGLMKNGANTVMPCELLHMMVTFNTLSKNNRKMAIGQMEQTPKTAKQLTFVGRVWPFSDNLLKD